MIILGETMKKCCLAIVAFLFCVQSYFAQDKAAVSIVPPEGEAAKYWPRWRGPSGQGVVEGNYPDTWSDTKNVLWKAEVPGRGNSSPIIWKDRIFLTTA